MTRDTRDFVVYNGRLQRVRSLQLTNKPFEAMSTLRKLTSLSYMGFKLREWLHKPQEQRDTIAIEQEEQEVCQASMHEIICCEELMAEPEKVAPGRESRRSSITTTRTSDSDASCFSHCFTTDDAIAYEPTKDQRWCLNCNKCFQRQLSHYDYYCGLDCKTAHHMRMTTCS